MLENKIYLGDTLIRNNESSVDGVFVNIKNERFYCIANYDRMPDFFMALVSDSDHWLYISSNGSLSAGRKNRDNALFPYYTEDKIHDYCGITGSKTVCLFHKNEKTYLWEPFSKALKGVYKITRNLYKSVNGNKIIFEEMNHELGVSYRYRWSFSEKFGFVKESVITNISRVPIKVSILDGIGNILPSGVDYAFQNEYSNLLDAYKKAELLEKTGLGLFMLSSIPVDRAEPSESLNATTVWSVGLTNRKILISDKQLLRFSKGLALQPETDIRASRGAYYISGTLELSEKQSGKWTIVAEINQNSTDVAKLNHLLASSDNLSDQVADDIEKGTGNLKKIVANADGLQCSNEELCTVRHFFNTLYNVMRGGIFPDNYNLASDDFKKFVHSQNRQVAIKFQSFLNGLPEKVSVKTLLGKVRKEDDADLFRICYEYLPLTFSRRHGDPSRPWNIFSIENKNDDGSPKLDYQGNWRDIFQNWEALLYAYPGYVEHIISKFLNATTPDGYNPYRILRNGIDWECPDPDDPWAYIGYWGDHQIIYLQKLLELSVAFNPGHLQILFEKEIFSFANVPYRIRPFEDIVKNPKDTIEFDHDLNNKIGVLTKEIGADGKLLMDDQKQVYCVNLIEKILITLLAKLSNFIPEAGIWLNTQRPEWNDANNALVGNGASMVTLYYLRRFLKFWYDQFKVTGIESVAISVEVKDFFDVVFKLFRENTGILKHGFSNKERRYFANNLGEAGSVYREKIYTNAFSNKKEKIDVIELKEFIQVALTFIDQSIKVNKREDGLYHAYNLIAIQEEEITIRPLYEMLEGQVAVLSAGYLNSNQSLEVLNALKSSALFRKDQYSYLLYPDRTPPRFTEKNNIPAQMVKRSKLLSKLISDGNTSVVEIDHTGNFHFNGSFRNAELLSQAIDKLDPKRYGGLIKKEKNDILNIYEQMFDHQSFTGRSGTFYGYEGLGSIYWHMVSKLLLATQECFFRAMNEGADPEVVGNLKDHYYEIKAGIGLYKSPALYGAFPTDAYSHTPGNSGAQQPGMTGQVKEDIISRIGEMGIQIAKGQITFIAGLFNRDEVLTSQLEFKYLSLENQWKSITLKPGQWAVTFCQVPFVFTAEKTDKIIVHLNHNQQIEITGNKLSRSFSEEIFNRTGRIVKAEILMKL